MYRVDLSLSNNAMASFARDLGYDDTPFGWDEERRAQLRAELNGWYAPAYGLTRDALRYGLDPKDVMGADHPSETSRVLQKNQTVKYGEYRTAGSSSPPMTRWSRVACGCAPKNIAERQTESQR